MNKGANINFACKVSCAVLRPCCPSQANEWTSSVFAAVLSYTRLWMPRGLFFVYKLLRRPTNFLAKPQSGQVLIASTTLRFRLLCHSLATVPLVITLVALSERVPYLCSFIYFNIYFYFNLEVLWLSGESPRLEIADGIPLVGD